MQIGLGTFGSFLHNLTDPDEVYESIQWLLEACSNSSTSLLGVGVEPVSEHLEKLRPTLLKLPNSSLVRAAVKSGDDAFKKDCVYMITSEKYKSYVDQVPPDKLQEFVDSMLYFQNMSCVGQEHPEFRKNSQRLEQKYGVKVEMEPVDAWSVSYQALSQWLRFSGVEVLVIDAEGFDCQILRSMLDYCSQPGRRDSWPSVIQFETMGHSDKIDGSGAEQAILHSLTHAGYLLAASGKDTQLVHEDAISRERTVARWVATFWCKRCGLTGKDGMPFAMLDGHEMVCKKCGTIHWVSGISWDHWETLPGDICLACIAAKGDSVWGIDKAGSLLELVGGEWHDHEYGGMQQISLLPRRTWAKYSDVFGVDTKGQAWHLNSRYWSMLPPIPTGNYRLTRIAPSTSGVWCLDEDGAIHVYNSFLQRWTSVEGRLVDISVSVDGSRVWGVNASCEVYYRAGVADRWKKMWGHLDQISVSSDGAHAWGLHDGYIFYRPGVSGEWSRVPGWLARVCACGERVWGLGAQGRVWTLSLWGRTLWEKHS